MRLRIAGGTIVCDGRRERADVLLEGGLIAAVGEVDETGATVVDAGGCLVLPGGVDPHTHAFGAIETDTISAL